MVMNSSFAGNWNGPPAGGVNSPPPEEEFLDRAFAALRDGRFNAHELARAWHQSLFKLREHPRFFELARQFRLGEFREARGYPPGCTRVSSSGGERLDCPGMRGPVR
jgi:hypothetical protein